MTRGHRSAVAGSDRRLKAVKWCRADPVSMSDATKVVIATVGIAGALSIGLVLQTILV